MKIAKMPLASAVELSMKDTHKGNVVVGIQCVRCGVKAGQLHISLVVSCLLSSLAASRRDKNVR